MKKYLFLFILGFITIDAFSGIVIYNRSTGGAGPDGYKNVRAFGVSIGNFTSVTIQCHNPGPSDCPETVDAGVVGYEEQLDQCEISYINDVISRVDQKLDGGVTDSHYTGHYRNTVTKEDYYYQAIWYINSEGNQITQILKL